MGNTAISNMGSMPPPGLVRVLQADGKALHFPHPVLAIQVMQEQPGHLVVKCGPPSMPNEMIREERLYGSLTYERMKQMALKDKVLILRADEELDQRSTHYLLPIKSSKKQAGFSWNSIIRALKNSGKVASSFELERTSDSARCERRFSMMRRSRSLPRYTGSNLHVQQDEQQPKPQQKQLSPSVSFPATRTGGQSLSNPFMEGMGWFQELPPLQCQPLHHKRPRRIRVRPSLVGWKPILESISEVVDEFSDDEDYSGDFYKSQSKCLRRLHSFESPIVHLRPVEV